MKLIMHPLNITLIFAALALYGELPAAALPQIAEGDFVLKDFKFKSGETLPELRLHYRTMGQPRKDSQGVVRNAVLAMHGTTGSGASLTVPSFAGVLCGPGGLLDAARYYIVFPDGIGHGKSSKPSDGLHARFPKYTYDDMVLAEYRLLTEGLGVNHLRLVIGTSMGGMHTWLWGETYPDFMDALMPLASAPVEIAGRNRVWREMIIDAIRNDPGWNSGEYKVQPRGMETVADVMAIMGGARCTCTRKPPRATPRTAWLGPAKRGRAPPTPTTCSTRLTPRASTTPRRVWTRSKPCWLP